MFRNVVGANHQLYNTMHKANESAGVLLFNFEHPGGRHLWIFGDERRAQHALWRLRC